MTTATPTQATAGDTIAWTVQDARYPAGPWQLAYVFHVAGAAVTINGVPDGDAWAVRIPPATSASWPAGAVRWQATVSDGTDRYTLATGQIQIAASIAALIAGTDLRSHAERTLAAIEAKLEGRAGSGIDEYQIAGRQLKYIPIPDLLRLRDRYRAEVNAERAGQQTGAGRRILTRL
mgnify:CR=1 FL=1|jgi:hypothetical protein